MNIKIVHIKNFRSCKDVKIEFGSMHSLVGANNAGKSSILRALDFFFNPSSSKVDDETFWNRDTTLTIWVEIIFSNLTESEKGKLSGYLQPDDTFHVARSAKIHATTEDPDRASSDESKVAISQHFCKLMPTLDWLNSTKINGSSIDEWWRKKEELVINGNSFSDFVGGSRPNVTGWKQKAEEFTQQYLTPDDYHESWSDNPSGYAGVLKAVLPLFILVPAVRDVTDEAKVTKTNPLGRLLHAVIESVTDEQRDILDKSLKEMQKKLNRGSGTDRLPAIVETEERLNSVLKEYMNCDLEIEFQTPTLDVVLTTPKIFADDGFRNVVENKGHGLQRAIIFSIIRCYSELITGKGEQKKRTMIFAVEEPELYMHPQAQRTIRRVFKNISENSDQVIYSTHSSLLLDVSDFDQIIRVESLVTQTNGKKLVQTRVWQLPIASMIKDVSNRHPGATPTEHSIRELYANAYHPLRAEGFFAQKIILVEGPTEQYSIPIYAEAAGYQLDNLNIGIVDCGGKGQMDRLYRIFNELGISCYMLFDYDKDNPDGEIIAKSKELLQLCGQAVDSPNTVLVCENFAYFPHKWETDLATEINGFEQLTSDARRSMGLSAESGKPLVARYVARTLTAKHPPEVPHSLKAIIEKAINVCWTRSCLNLGN